MTVWMIFHRGDNRFVYEKTRILKRVGGRPLVALTQRVTSDEFLFPTKKKARNAAERMNNG